MLIFTTPRMWEEDSGVWQVLVFSNQEVAERFESLVNDQNRQKTAAGFPDENDIGAIYKLRAVKNSDGTWTGLVRCGFTARLLLEADRRYPVYTYQAALRKAARDLLTLVNKDFADFEQAISAPEGDSDADR